MTNKYLVMIALSLCTNFAFGQQKLVKDIDFDGVQDTVYLDAETSEIVCRLSGTKFKKISSKGIDESADFVHIGATKNGFECRINWMRAGYANQFRYNKALKKVQLIGMSRYEFGNAANDGSGESSVNLLTGDYIGDWNYFDDLANKGNGELIKIPQIKTKLLFKQTFLEDFSVANYELYADSCSKLYEQAKARTKLLKTHTKS